MGDGRCERCEDLAQSLEDVERLVRFLEDLRRLHEEEYGARGTHYDVTSYEPPA